LKELLALKVLKYERIVFEDCCHSNLGIITIRANRVVIDPVERATRSVVAVDVVVVTAAERTPRHWYIPVLSNADAWPALSQLLIGLRLGQNLKVCTGNPPAFSGLQKWS
jgi:hypothetical protein